MEWLEVSVEVENELAEAVAEVLSRYAHRGVVIEAGPEGWGAGPVAVRAYLPSGDDLWDDKRAVEKDLGHLSQIQPIPEPTFRTVAERDWAEAWKERLSVPHVGQRMVIQPSWLDYSPEPEEVVIRLDPGMAFGTGLHPTTQMCLAALEDYLAPGGDVLDLGTGSGILAIAAAKLGAGHVLAVDNDPQAIEVARENVRANGTQDAVTVRQGSLAETPGDYDVVAVNILARVIVEMVEEGLAARMRPDGVLITAGINTDQTTDVIGAFKRGGFSLIGRRQRGDWVSLMAKVGYS